MHIIFLQPRQTHLAVQMLVIHISPTYILHADHNHSTEKL